MWPDGQLEVSSRRIKIEIFLTWGLATKREGWRWIVATHIWRLSDWLIPKEIKRDGNFIVFYKTRNNAIYFFSRAVFNYFQLSVSH